jgi:hypothetical protein
MEFFEKFMETPTNTMRYGEQRSEGRSRESRKQERKICENNSYQKNF